LRRGLSHDERWRESVEGCARLCRVFNRNGKWALRWRCADFAIQFFHNPSCLWNSIVWRHVVRAHAECLVGRSAGFICAGLGLSTIVPVIWGVAGRDQVIGAGPALATVTTVGHFGFLTGPPLIGAVATFLNIDLALIVVALFGVAIALSSRATSART